MGFTDRPPTSLDDPDGFAGRYETLEERVRRLELKQGAGGVYYDLIPHLRFDGSFESGVYDGYVAVEYADSDGPFFGVHVTGGRAFLCGAVYYDNNTGANSGGDLLELAMPAEAQPSAALTNIFSVLDFENDSSTPRYTWPTMVQWDVTRSGFIAQDHETLPGGELALRYGTTIVFEGQSWSVDPLGVLD